MKQFPFYILISFLVSSVLLTPSFVFAASLADEIWNALSLGIGTFAFFFVINVFGTFVFFAANLLDFGINTFVIGFGDVFVSSGVGVAVNNVWVIIRDFVNLLFIFGFVYIGFKMILNANDSNTRRWLVNIILAALLVNFSLFATKFVIDISNQLAAQIAVNGLGAGATVDPKTNLIQVDVSTEFTARMGLQSLWGIPNPQSISYVIGSAFLLLTAMFVFAAGGILLLIRFAVLNLYMVLSPVMFIGWVFPPLDDKMREFWSGLIKQAFFAPIYLLFIYFSLQILSGLQQSVGQFNKPDWRQTFQKVDPNASAFDGNLGTFPFFILICIFLALSIVAAQKLSAVGGDTAVRLGRSFSSRVRKVAVNNSAGFAARGVNRLSAGAQSKYERMDARLANMKGPLGSLARGARMGVNVATLGITSDKALQSTFKAGKGLRIDGSQTADDVDKEAGERRGRQSKALAEMDREKKMAEYNEAIDQTAMSAHDLQEAFDGMKKTIGDMSNDERMDLGIKKLTDERYAVHLSDAHIEAMEKSGKFSYDEIQNIKSARSKARVSMANGGNPPARLSAAEQDLFKERQRQSLVSGSPQDIGKLSVDIFKNPAMAQYLTPAMIEQRMRNGLKDSDRVAIKTEIDNHITQNLTANTPAWNMWDTWKKTVYGAQFFS